MFKRLALACLTAATATAALAQDFPSRTVTMVVPYAAGDRPTRSHASSLRR